MKKNYSIYAGSLLPNNVQEHLEEQNAFQYGGQCTHHIVNDQNPKDWAVVTDNGGSYKAGAMYIIWTPQCSKAIYSTQSLIHSIELLVDGKGEEFKQYCDPDYMS